MDSQKTEPGVKMPPSNKETEAIDIEIGNANTQTIIDDSVWFKVRKWIRSVGAEELGIEPISDELRTNQPVSDLGSLFLSANVNTATLALGYLGPALFGMGWWDSFLSIVFFNLLGGIFPAIVSCFGPKLGLRTIVISRFCFGWWPGKAIALLVVLNEIGWGMVNGISGASVMYDAADGRIPLAVCVLILGLLAIIFGLLGYRFLHIYDRYSWYVMFVAFVIVAGFAGQHVINLPMGSGPLEASSVLSFGTGIIGFELAWLPVAADYGVYIKRDVSDVAAFSWSYAGLLVSQVLIELLGAAIGTLISSPDASFVSAYDARGMGGLIGSVFNGHGGAVRGFGRFIEVIISFSTVAVITTNIYSFGLDVQMVSKRLLVVPRLIWSLIGSIIFLVCAIAGRDSLEEVMENFLLICAYWIVPFAVIMLLEHVIWRRGYQYDLMGWNDKTKLPPGIAASVTLVIGTVLSILSMSQAWWVGPIAAGIGGSDAGTDVSWMLATGVCALLYVPLRWWERRRWSL